MEQFEQLLTCAICLDRYRNPKLLPCQHSFCMEPCLEGLVDYVRRQVKCPECRAEHRIPYQGVQGFPTNVTLQRFLELHIEITGELPDPTSGQVMERCNVCSEKAYCSFCSHCDKKICEECKGAHMDILRREIARINNQIRRGIHRLQDTLAIVERNTQNIQTNCLSVSEEVEEIYRRLSKALKDRTEYLRNEIDKYLGTELRSLTNLKENLELEIANILSNCDLADKHMNENVPWDDCELMDAKEIFLKTVEFIRNFEYENSDYSRKVRLILAHDPNQLVLHVAGYGDLNIANLAHSFGTGSTGLLQPPGGPGLMRSKSDHRLASQFRQQDDRSYDRGYGESGQEELPLGGRKFGERAQRTGGDRYDRYGRGSGTDYGDDYDESRPSARSRYRSRFARHATADNDSDGEQTTTRGVRFAAEHKNERERPLDTEDVARGPLSGITRLADSPRVMKKLQESETNKKKEKDAPAPPPPQPVQPKVVPKRPPPPTTRQVSEDDEISRIKKQNKGATTSTATETETRTVKRDETEHGSTRKTPAPEAATSAEESDESATSPQQTLRKTPVTKPAATTRRPSDAAHKKTTRSASSESTTSTESSAGSSSGPRTTGAAYTTEEVKQKYLSRGSIDSTPDTPRSRIPSTGAKDATPTKPFQSRFLNKSTPTPPPPKEEETETSTEEETETEEESDDNATGGDHKDMSKTDIGPLLARSAQARDNGSDPKRKDDSSSFTRSRYGSQREESPLSKYSRSRTTGAVQDEEPPSKYGYTSRFLNKSKSSAAVPPEEEEHSRYGGDDSESIAAAAAVGTSPRSRYLQKCVQLFEIGSRGSEPGSFTWPRGVAVGPDNSIVVADSSNHRVQVFDVNGKFLKEFGQYGNGEGEFDCLAGVAVNRIGQYIIADRYNHRIQVFDPSGRFLRAFGSQGTADGRFNYPWGITTDALGFIYVCDKENHRVQVFQSDGTFVGKFGSMGNKLGQLEHPHYIAVSNTNRVIVSDSNNHRIQVFDVNGKVLSAFGNEGAGDGEFKFPRGVAVDDQGYIFVADSGNNRIQIFNPDGTFLRSFGIWGSSKGEFKGLEGVAVTPTGNILVCDRENHRIQVF